MLIHVCAIIVARAASLVPHPVLQDSSISPDKYLIDIHLPSETTENNAKHSFLKETKSRSRSSR